MLNELPPDDFNYVIIPCWIILINESGKHLLIESLLIYCNMFFRSFNWAQNSDLFYLVFFPFSIIGVVIDCQFIFIFIDLPALLLGEYFYCIFLTVLRCNLETGAYGKKWHFKQIIDSFPVINQVIQQVPWCKRLLIITNKIPFDKRFFSRSLHIKCFLITSPAHKFLRIMFGGVLIETTWKFSA